MNLVYPVCILGGIALILPWFLLYEQRRNRRHRQTALLRDVARMPTEVGREMSRQLSKLQVKP